MNSNNNERPAGVLGTIFKWVLVVITAISAIGLLCAYLACYVNPNSMWVFTFFGLGATFLFIWNAILLLVWVVMWNVWAVIPLVTLVGGIGIIGDLVQVSFARHYDVEIARQPSQIKILTYNVHGFRQFGVSGHSNRSTMGAIARWVVEEDPDVVCFQEFQYYTTAEFEMLNHNLDRWKYSKFSYIVDDPFHKWGLAVYSKYPLINFRPIRFEYHENSSMVCDMIVGRDTVSLYNCHLQTTAYNRVNPAGMAAFRGDDAEQVVRAVGYNLKENAKIRAMQADTMASLIHGERQRYPKIVVGDFNAPPVSYSYHTMRGDMHDSFVECGRGYEYTYKPIFKLFRIDYILYSRDGIEAVTHESPDMPWSDHKPVISRLKIN